MKRLRFCVPSEKTLALITTIVMAAVVVLLAGAVAYLIASDIDGRERDRQAGRAAIQQNVRARYDDCLNGEQLRAALRTQVKSGRRTEPLLYKLVPSLDTPEVHRLVQQERERQLKAYAPVDCREFALAAVPPGSRSEYRVPGP